MAASTGATAVAEVVIQPQRHQRMWRRLLHHGVHPRAVQVAEWRHGHAVQRHAKKKQRALTDSRRWLADVNDGSDLRVFEQRAKETEGGQIERCTWYGAENSK